MFYFFLPILNVWPTLLIYMSGGNSAVFRTVGDFSDMFFSSYQDLGIHCT